MIKTASHQVITFFISLLFLGTIEAQTIQLPTGKTIDSKLLNAFLEKEMKSTNTPGLSIAIINNGHIAFHSPKGLSRPNQKVIDKTIFEAASLSKPLFGYYAMYFVEQDLLDLDKPLYKYLPYSAIAYDERYKKITARMVLSHKTGFPNWRTGRPDHKLTIDFEPGSKFQYSGEGYQYLALVLQQILKTDAKGLQKTLS
ncbi:MAG: beta-lactamase family protein [Flavobacteriaceae bacterium]